MFTRVIKDASIATIKNVQNRSHMLNASSINMDQFKSNSQSFSQNENLAADTVTSSMTEAKSLDHWCKTFSNGSRDTTSIFDNDSDIKMFTRVIKDASIATIKNVQTRSHMISSPTTTTFNDHYIMHLSKENVQNICQNDKNTSPTASTNNNHTHDAEGLDLWSKPFRNDPIGITPTVYNNDTINRVNFKLFLCQF